jgi:hypothetical protein
MLITSAYALFAKTDENMRTDYSSLKNNSAGNPKPESSDPDNPLFKLVNSRKSQTVYGT